MKIHDYRRKEAKRLQWLPSAVLLLMSSWLLASPSSAAIMQEENPLELRPPAGETGVYFGFTLAHYINNSQRWLLVGAPKSNISDPSVPNSGGLYKCPLNQTSRAHVCSEVYVNLTKHTTNWFTSNNSQQGLGFSLASSDKEIVVCAPLWYGSKKMYNKESYLPVGNCFSAASPSYDFKFFSPPFEVDSTPQMSFLTTGYCQFGMSATYIQSQDTFAVGAPGCYGWQGETWEVEPTSKSSKLIGELERKNLGLESDTWSLFYLYLGYSVGSFKFGGKTSILSSMPRTIWELGRSTASFGPAIFMLEENPNNSTLLNVKGRIVPSKVTTKEVIFSFFGYSLATLDVNGDGMEDLIVGAPLYQSPSGQNQGTATGFDHGAIFVYMQKAYESHENKEKIYKMEEEKNAPQRIGKEFSRFGSCVSAIGDIDGDGYEDLAVGAPFMEVEGGTGEVYIYMGSQDGLEKNAHQILRAKPNHLGFGVSIAQKLQIVEGKGYDIAVGIHESDKVLVYWSKEVVEVIWNLTFSGPIDLLQKTCACVLGGGYCPCVDAKVCVMHRGKFNKFEDKLILDFNVTLNTESDELLFENEKSKITKNITVIEGEEFCETVKVTSKPDMNEVTVYSFTAELSLTKEKENAVLDRHSTLKKKEELSVLVQCGSTGNVEECKSNINLHYDVLASYIYGSQNIKLIFTVENQGDTAYSSRLFIESDDQFEIYESNTSGPACGKTEGKIECKLGHIFDNSKKIITLELTLTRMPEPVDSHPPFFSLRAEVVTLSTISNPDTAVENIQVNITVPGSLELVGNPPEPSIVYFNSSSYYKAPEHAEDEEKLGPEIKHKYTILNSNDFSIYGADLIIHWPLAISGKYFLYLLNEPKINGIQSSCQYSNGEPDPFKLVNSTMVRHSPEDERNVLTKSAPSMGLGSKSLEYMIITCHFGELKGGNTEATIELRSRLVQRTLAELEAGTAVTNASSYVDLQITKMPFSVPPPAASHKLINTKISYKDSKPEAKVPVWLYVVATLGGLLILAVIIAILWKFGFFNRKKVPGPESEEKEQEGLPLNTNEDEQTAHTPLSPMMNETEGATHEFDYQAGRC